MNNTIDARVETVKKEHLELLKMAYGRLLESKDNFHECTNDVISVLDYDEKSIKKYEAMVNAQDLIVTLTQQILEAKDVEEIIALRKKLNYYINKIKGELKKREVDQPIIDNYQEEVTYFRKKIAGYIRFLKREDNICEIENLFRNYDNLSLEEITTLKKCLTRENNYNKRNMKALESEEKSLNNLTGESRVNIIPLEVISNEKVEPIINDNTAIQEMVLVNPQVNFSINNSQQKIIESDYSLKRAHLKDYEVKIVASDSSYENMDEYFNDIADKFSYQYQIKTTFDYYKNNLGKNLCNFVRNVPRYIHNKKAIKHMKKDYSSFYSGNDLLSFMEYMQQRNSIHQGLKCVFDRSHLFNDDMEYLNNHENCARWMYNYCVEKSLPIWVKTRSYEL